VHFAVYHKVRRDTEGDWEIGDRVFTKAVKELLGLYIVMPESCELIKYLNRISIQEVLGYPLDLIALIEFRETCYYLTFFF
jgi:hypothetical protein